jgi:MFS family permease
LETAPVLRKTFRALRIRSYRLLWAGFVGTWLGLQMQQVARGYLAFSLTHSALAIGEVTLAMGLPRIFLSPFGGALADRYPKKVVLVWSQVLQAAVSGATALLVWSHRISVSWLVGLGLVQGLGFAVNVPVRQAMVPDLVGDPEDLPNAVALNNAGINGTRLVGPSLAGLLIDAPGVGLTGTFALCAACFAAAVAAAVRLPDVPAAAPRADAASGLRYLFGSPALLALMSLGFVPLALGMPYVQLMPVFAIQVLRWGASGLGLLLTVVGVGGLLGTLATAYLSDRPDRASLQLRLGVAFGVALAAFAACSSLRFVPGVVVSLAVAGMCGDAYLALNSTLLLLNTERSMYGRVMGVYMVLQSVRQVSVLPVGAVADALGAPLTVGAAGVLTAAFVGGVRLWYPRYRDIG